jgi:hypothetical protein
MGIRGRFRFIALYVQNVQNVQNFRWLSVVEASVLFDYAQGTEGLNGYDLRMLRI